MFDTTDNEMSAPMSDKKTSLTTTLVSVGASALVLFVTVYVIGKAWQRSQKA
jgi:hypothetical protein